ncbi:hypothetical protein BASA81_008898 [Batrachochytrium salamandrivorans]|nr:hypothetical protein BASA81_008898 [Batrachochytrium salamandrivorans]
MGNFGATPAAVARPTPMERLLEMGFPPAACELALEMHGNDLDLALQTLMDQRQVEEREKRAQAASARHAKLPNKPSRPATTPSKPVVHNTKPALELLQDQSQVIDTLFYVLNTIVENPSEIKYRSLKTTNKRFGEIFNQDQRVRALADKFLTLDCGFEKAGEYFALAPDCDFSKLIKARDALQAIQISSPQYFASKQRLEFERILVESQQTHGVEENQRRLHFLQLLPPQPDVGEAGTTRIQVFVSDGGRPLQRTFASHDTLLDVVHFIGSERSLVGQKLATGAWSLVDETLLEKQSLQGKLDRTLFALGLWPSAVLHVRL